MATVGYTAGTGTLFFTDLGGVSGAHMNVVKLAISTSGGETLIPATLANGLTVDVTRVQGTVTVVQSVAANLKVDASGVAVPVTDNAGSLTVDAPVGTPVAVRISDGLVFVAPALEHVTAASPHAVRVSDGTGFIVPAQEHTTAASPHAVRLTDGATFYDGVKTGQLPAALVGGRLDVNVGAAIPAGDNAIGRVKLTDGTTVVGVTVGGLLKVDGSGVTQPVSGTTTSNQGTPAAVANSWPVKVSDGTDTVGISTVGAAKALKVDVVQAAADAAAFTDKTAFTEGTSKAYAVAGVFNDTITADPAEDQAAALRITQKRGLHVNLRNASGTELGVAAAPVRVDPTGTTPQPVSGTVTATLSATTNAGATAKTADFDTGAGTDTVTLFGIALPKAGGAVAGGTSTDPIRVDPTGTTPQPVSGTVTVNQGTANATPWNQNLSQVGGSAVGTVAAGVQKVGIVDEANAAYSQTNPLPTEPAGLGQTPVRKNNTYAASETAIAIWTPAGGKKFILTALHIQPSATGALTIFDNTNGAGNIIFDGTVTTGAGGTIIIPFPTPHPSSAINNVLRYTTGAGAAGAIVALGYEV